MEKYTINVQFQDKDHDEVIKTIPVEVEANNLKEAEEKAIETVQNNPKAYLKDYLEEKLRIKDLNRNSLIKIHLE